jgi:large subunit ribosomal protein L30
MTAARGPRAAAGGSRLEIRQVKSGIGFEQSQKATLRALGLGRIGRVRVHPDNPQVRGMIDKVRHLVVARAEAPGTGGRSGS